MNLIRMIVNIILIGISKFETIKTQTFLEKLYSGIRMIVY